MSSFKDFDKLMRSQDPSERVNHNDGWNQCAVGRFYKSCVKKGSLSATCSSPHRTIAPIIGPEIMAFCNNPEICRTYGDIVEFIETKVIPPVAKLQHMNFCHHWQKVIDESRTRARQEERYMGIDPRPRAEPIPLPTYRQDYERSVRFNSRTVWSDVAA